MGHQIRLGNVVLGTVPLTIRTGFIPGFWGSIPGFWGYIPGFWGSIPGF